MILGWQSRVVISGSMLPTIRPGDVALVGAATPGPGTLPPGRIVLVRDPTRSTGYYLHRVRGYDAHRKDRHPRRREPVDDYPAVDPAQVVGQLRLVVPLVGLPMLWWQQHEWVRLGALAGVSWSSLVLALGLRSRSRR